MKFDSNLAWRQASATVSANRDVLLALAGVFFLLPRLVLSLFMPEPQSRPNMTPAEMMEMLQNFYLQIAPYAIPMMLFQAVGTLAMLTLFTDRSRPTVGQAIRQGARGLFPYLAAQFLLVVVICWLATRVNPSSEKALISAVSPVPAARATHVGAAGWFNACELDASRSCSSRSMNSWSRTRLASP